MTRSGATSKIALPAREIAAGAELLDKWRHLHRLRPRAENYQDFTHNTVS